MKNLRRANGKIFILVIGIVLGLQSPGRAQGTAFTYQGRLNLNDSPAAGSYDFRYRLATDALGSGYVGSAFLTNGVPVTNGLFLTTLDFGAGIFTGSNYWLQIEVKTNGAPSYILLNPLQALTPTPYAVFANTAGNVSGTVAAAQIGGTLLNSSLPTSPVFSGAVAANAFSGNGAGVTNVNAASLNGLAASNLWQLGGNTVSAGQFLGSTNYQAVELWVGNVRALRLEPDPRGLNAANLIGGFPSNSVSPVNSGGNTIAGGGYGGGPNLVLSNSSGIFIGAGSANQVGPNVNDSAIGGGFGNTVQSPDAIIGGGNINIIQKNSPLSAIVGGQGNSIQPNVYQGFIGGGNFNTIQDGASGAIIAGGTGNIIHTNASGSIIVGGYDNESSDFNTFIGGGVQNTILTGALDSFVGGGTGNSVGLNSVFSTIAGGAYNIIQANVSASTVGGGRANQAGGNFATVPGGYDNAANADNSFAAGTFAQAIHTGAFVLSDTRNEYFYSTAPDQLSARFQGGIRFVTFGAGMTLDGSPMLVSGGTGDGSGLGNLNASQLTSGIVPLAALSGLTSAQLSALTWQLATNLDGGRAALASNVVSGISITNAFITNSTFAGNGGGLTNLGASQLSGGLVPLARLSGLTSNQLDAATWQLATNLNGGNATLASNLVSGISITNVFITNSIFAGNGGGLTNLNAAQISGAVASANLAGTYGNALTLNNAGNSFTGNGSGLTGLNASQLSSGTVADARLSANVALLNGNQTFTGANNLNNPGNNFTGTFHGNGAGLASIDLVTNSGGLIAASGNFLSASSPAVGSGPAAVVAVDVNGDGKVDVITANSFANTLSVLTNNGSGGFALASSPGVGAGPAAVTAADVNGDGKMDLICANLNGSTLSVLTNNGSGGFSLMSSPVVGSGPRGLTTADVNGDGKVDLISANYVNNTISVLTNNGSGGFALVSTVSGMNGPSSVTATDINGDGKVDLICANNNNSTISVLTNNGGGIFTVASTLFPGANPYAVTTADVNGNGKADLIVTLLNGTVAVYNGNGSGGFAGAGTYAVGSFPTAVVAADVNGDGHLDLVCADFGVTGNSSGSGNMLSVLINDGNGGFGQASSLTVGTGPQAVVAADVNGDGKLDLISANTYSSTVSVFFNTLSFNGTFTGIVRGSGSITSPMWKATEVFNNIIGALPKTNSFTTGGGTLMIFAAGSGYATNAGAALGMDIKLDGNAIGSCNIFANPSLTHLAFVPGTLVQTGVTAGTHTLSLSPHAGTTTDATDTFSVTVQELPF